MTARTFEEMAKEPVLLPPQLWIDHNESGPPRSDRLVAPPRANAWGAPHGGLWTSTLTGDRSSSWLTYLRDAVGGYVPTVRRRAWILNPVPARVWESRDRGAHLDLLSIAPEDPSQIWVEVAARFDAVRMTQHAAAKVFFRSERPDTPDAERRARVLAGLSQDFLLGPLDMWSSESTCWFDWRFEEPEDAGWIDVPTIS